MSDVDEWKAELRGELLAAWSAGMCDGLEMAAQMAGAVAASPRLTAEQLAAVEGLRNAIRERGLEMAAQERTR